MTLERSYMSESVLQGQLVVDDQMNSSRALPCTTVSDCRRNPVRARFLNLTLHILHNILNDILNDCSTSVSLRQHCQFGIYWAKLELETLRLE